MDTPKETATDSMGTPKLTEQELDEFARYIESGQLEKDFAEGCEHDRFYLLGLMEKLMDVAELADAAATRCIFKGSLGAMLPESAAKGEAAPDSPDSPDSSDSSDSSDSPNR